MSRLPILVEGAVVLALGLPAPGFAQAQGRESELTNAGVGVQGLEEVIVTANRRPDEAQKSSLAIQVIGADELQQQGVLQLRDLTALVPGFSIGERGSFAQVYVRGIGSFVTTPLDESPISINLDEVTLSSPAGISGMFFDVERLEVLKGPQGTLYGRNASGGALNIVTRKPDFSGVNGYASVDLGNYELKHVDGALNVPVSDSLAIRGAFQIVDRDGYYSDGSGDDEHQSARLHALWRPSETVSLLVTGDYAHLGGEGSGYSMVPRVDPGDPYVGLLDPRVSGVLLGINPTLKPFSSPSQDNSTYGVSANLEWELGPTTLNVIPAWRRTDMNFVTAGSGSDYSVRSGEPQTTLEVRLASNTDAPFQWLGGAYYFNVDKHSAYVSDFGTQNQLTIESGDLETESYAAFGDATFSLTDRFRLIGGLRYTHESKDLEGSTDTTARGVRSVAPASGSLSFNETTWKAGLEYDAGDSAMVFLTVATGFKAGGIVLTRGPDGTPNNPFPNTYDPEMLTAYTLGLKSRWFDQRLQLNIEGFYWDYEDQQITQNGPVNPIGTLGRVVINAPEAPTLHGVDMSAQWLITPADLLSVDVAYLNTEYDELLLIGSARSSAQTTGCAIGPASDPRLRTLECSGFPLIRSPEWSGSVAFRHTFDLNRSGRLIAGVRTQFSTGYFSAIDYLPTQWQDDYTSTSIDLTYEAPSERWSVTAYAKNLEDEAVAAASRTHAFAPGVSFDILNAPRTYGVRLRADF